MVLAGRSHRVPSYHLHLLLDHLREPNATSLLSATMSGPNIPPGNPTMAPPPLPPPSSTQGSRSSSPRKRKRDDSSPRRSTASSDFSMSVKNKIQASVIDSGKCWHCKASPGEYSHVIASRDPDVRSISLHSHFRSLMHGIVLKPPRARPNQSDITEP